MVPTPHNSNTGSSTAPRVECGGWSDPPPVHHREMSRIGWVWRESANQADPINLLRRGPNTRFGGPAVRTYGLGRILCRKSGTFFKKDPIFLFFFWREKDSSLEGHSGPLRFEKNIPVSPVPNPRLFTVPPHLTHPKSRSPSNPSLPRGASKGDAGRDGAPPRRRRRREPGFRSISSLPHSGTHSLARAAPVWFVEVRGIGQGLSSFIRWMDVCRFSVDLAPGDV